MQDVLGDIHQYNNALAISQVVRFFERKGVNITKSMIQNYVRDGLLPPPLNKRYYTPKHLAALALIDYLKSVFDMPRIKAVLTPLMDAEGLPPEVYAMLLQVSEQLAMASQAHLRQVYTHEHESPHIPLLLIMLQSAYLKEIACANAETET